jgi:DinB family protein
MVEFEDELRSMPKDLIEHARGLIGTLVSDRAEDGGYSFIEHVWHLADLETAGYEVRIRRLLEEDYPKLDNFDGDGIAAKRNYRTLRLRDGLKAFAEARERNLGMLTAISGETWDRAGVQEGIGPVTLRDIPRMMHEHDESHRAEIEALLEELAQKR